MGAALASRSNRVHPCLVRVTLAVVCALGAALVGGVGCQANGPASTAQAAEPAPSGGGFDASRARADLMRLEEASRGSRGARKARKLLKRSLVESGFEVIEVETPLPTPGAEAERVTSNQVAEAERVGSTPVTHLFARLTDAEGRDAILLVAPFDASAAAIDGDEGDSGSASGAAVLLELARLHQRAFSNGATASTMTWWIALVDGDERAAPAASTAAAGVFPGSEALAAWIAARPDVERIRLVVFVDRVARPRLEVARDLRSNATYREVFFSEGAARGHAAFDPERSLSAPSAGHRAFAALGIAPTVAIVGEPVAPVPARLGAANPAADADPESLRAVGDTVRISLERIADWLARIDAFRRDPLRGGPGALSLPGADDPQDARPGEGEAAGGGPAPAADADAGEPAPAPARSGGAEGGSPGRDAPGDGSSETRGDSSQIRGDAS